MGELSIVRRPKGLRFCGGWEIMDDAGSAWVCVGLADGSGHGWCVCGARVRAGRGMGLISSRSVEVEVVVASLF